MVKLSELKGRVSHANRAATSPQLSVPRTLAHAFTDAQLQHAKQLFAFYDADNNGTVDRNELAQALSKLGAPVSEERLTLLMAEVDVNGNGAIDFGEFLSVLHSAHQPPLKSASSSSSPPSQSVMFSPMGGTGALLASVAESEAYHEYTDAVSEFERQLQKSTANATRPGDRGNTPPFGSPRTPAGEPSSISPLLSPSPWASPSPPLSQDNTLEFTPASAGGTQALQDQNNRSTSSVSFTPTPTPKQKPLARKVSFSIGGYSDGNPASDGKNHTNNMIAARPSALATPSPPGSGSASAWSPHTPADTDAISPSTASSTHSNGSSPPLSPRSALRVQSRVGAQVSTNNSGSGSGSGSGSSSGSSSSWRRRGSALAPAAAVGSGGGRASSSLEKFLSSSPGTYERSPSSSSSSAAAPVQGGGAKLQGSLSSLRNRKPSTMTSLDPFTRAGVAPPSYAAKSPPPIATSPVLAPAAAASLGMVISAEAPFAGLPPVSEEQVEAMIVPLHLKRRVTPEQVDAFRRLFLHFDNNYNNSGKLTVNEVCQALAMVGEEGTPARVAELSSSAMELLGSDNQSDASSDVVDFDEFCEIFARARLGKAYGPDSPWAQLGNMNSTAASPAAVDRSPLASGASRAGSGNKRSSIVNVSSPGAQTFTPGDKVKLHASRGCLLAKKGMFWSVKLDNGEVVEGVVPQSLSHDNGNNDSENGISSGSDPASSSSPREPSSAKSTASTSPITSNGNTNNKSSSSSKGGASAQAPPRPLEQGVGVPAKSSPIARARKLPSTPGGNWSHQLPESTPSGPTTSTSSPSSSPDKISQKSGSPNNGSPKSASLASRLFQGVADPASTTTKTSPISTDTSIATASKIAPSSSVQPSCQVQQQQQQQQDKASSPTGPSPKGHLPPNHTLARRMTMRSGGAGGVVLPGSKGSSLSSVNALQTQNYAFADLAYSPLATHADTRQTQSSSSSPYTGTSAAKVFKAVPGWASAAARTSHDEVLASQLPLPDHLTPLFAHDEGTIALSKYRQLFLTHDADNSGTIDRDELTAALMASGEQHVTPAKLDSLIDAVMLDRKRSDADDALNFGEFCQVMAGLEKPKLKKKTTPLSPLSQSASAPDAGDAALAALQNRLKGLTTNTANRALSSPSLPMEADDASLIDDLLVPGDSFMELKIAGKNRRSGSFSHSAQDFLNSPHHQKWLGQGKKKKDLRIYGLQAGVSDQRAALSALSARDLSLIALKPSAAIANEDSDSDQEAGHQAVQWWKRANYKNLGVATGVASYGASTPMKEGFVPVTPGFSPLTPETNSSSSSFSSSQQRSQRVSPPPTHPVDPQNPNPDLDTKRYLASLFPGATIRCSPNGMVVITPSSAHSWSPGGEARSSSPHSGSGNERHRSPSSTSSSRGRHRSRSRSKSPLSPAVDAWVSSGRVLPKADSLRKFMDSLGASNAANASTANEEISRPTTTTNPTTATGASNAKDKSTGLVSRNSATAASFSSRLFDDGKGNSSFNSGSGSMIPPAPPIRPWDLRSPSSFSSQPTVAAPSAAEAISAEANSPVVSPLSVGDNNKQQRRLSWATEVVSSRATPPAQKSRGSGSSCTSSSSDDDDDDNDNEDGHNNNNMHSNIGGGPWVTHLTPSLMASPIFTDAGRGTPLQTDDTGENGPSSELKHRVVASRGQSLINTLVQQEHNEEETSAEPNPFHSNSSNSGKNRNQPSSRPLARKPGKYRRLASSLPISPQDDGGGGGILPKQSALAPAAALARNGCAPGGAPTFSAMVAAACSSASSAATAGDNVATGEAAAAATSSPDAARNQAASPPGRSGHLTSFSMDLAQPMGASLAMSGRVVDVELNGQAHLAGVVSGSYVVGVGRFKVRGLDDIRAALNKERRHRDRRLGRLDAHYAAATNNNNTMIADSGARMESLGMNVVEEGDTNGKHVTFDNEEERRLSGFEEDDDFNEAIETGAEDEDTKIKEENEEVAAMTGDLAHYVAGLRAAQEVDEDDGNSDDESRLRSASTRAVVAYGDFGDKQHPPSASLLYSSGPREPSEQDDTAQSRFVLVVLQSPGPPAMASSLATTRPAGSGGYQSGMRSYYMTV